MIELIYTYVCDALGCETEKAVVRKIDSTIGLAIPLLPDGWTNRHLGPGEERQYCPIHSALNISTKRPWQR